MSKELEVAIHAAQEAGAVLVKGWETEIAIASKADNSLVTKVDEESEEKIIGIIKQHFPDHKITAEESGSQGESDYCWYIDPIDGTTNYSRRVPLCVVSIALAKGQDVILGVIYNPFTQELYQAEKGQGAYLNNQKIQSSNNADLEKAVIAVSYSHDKAIRARVAGLSGLTTNNRTKREYGSAAYELALLASGRLDVCFLLDHKSWDYAAGVVICTEAGAVVSSLESETFDLRETSVVAAGNQTLHQEFLNSIKDF